MKQLARNESFVDLLVEKEKNAHAYFELCVIKNGANNFCISNLEIKAGVKNNIEDCFQNVWTF